MDNADLTNAPKHKKLKLFFAILGIILIILFIFRFPLKGIYCEALPYEILWNSPQSSCYFDLAIKSNNINLCEKLPTSWGAKGSVRSKGECLGAFNNYKPDFNTAFKLERLYDYDYSAKEQCISLMPSFNEDQIYKCIRDVAVQKKDMGICNLLLDFNETVDEYLENSGKTPVGNLLWFAGAIEDNMRACKTYVELITLIESANKPTDCLNAKEESYNKDYCITSLAVKNKDVSICNELESNFKIDCITHVAFETRNKFLCWKIEAGDWKKECSISVDIARCITDKSFCLI